MKRIKIWFNVLKNFLFSFYGCKANIMSAEDTLEYSLKNQKSIIRLGDGEFNIMVGKGISYQDISEKLKNDMLALVDEYMKKSNQTNYLLCVPKFFMECSGFLLMKKRVYISSWAFSRRYFNKKFRQDIIYGDAFCFSHDNSVLIDNFFKKMKNKNCIFVHNDEKYAMLFEKKYNIDTSFIEIKKKNCYSDIDKIISSIEKKIVDKKESFFVILSAGPAGKIIARELSKRNIYVIDTGHCWDDPLIK